MLSIGGLIVRPLARGVAVAALPAVATYAGGYVADRAVSMIGDCFNRVRGRVKITIRTCDVYIVADGVPIQIDPAKKYEIIGGKLREITEDVCENWTVL